MSERTAKRASDYYLKWVMRLALIVMVISAGIITVYTRGHAQAEQDKGMRRAIIDLYKKVNPQKLGFIDTLLAKCEHTYLLPSMAHVPADIKGEKMNSCNESSINITQLLKSTP